MRGLRSLRGSNHGVSFKGTFFGGGKGERKAKPPVLRKFGKPSIGGKLILKSLDVYSVIPFASVAKQRETPLNCEQEDAKGTYTGLPGFRDVILPQSSTSGINEPPSLEAVPFNIKPWAFVSRRRFPCYPDLRGTLVVFCLGGPL